MSATVTYPDTYNRFADSPKITLDKINQSGGGGSGGSASVVAAILAARQVYTGAAPPAAPNTPSIAAIFYPDSGGPMQEWDTVSQAWV